MLLNAIKERVLDVLEARRARRITLTYARERAARGAAYLDQVMPGWYRRINADQLDMGNGLTCILGQLYGSFAAGLTGCHLINPSTAPRTSISPVFLGLLSVQGVCEALQEQDYENLNQAWLEEVNGRQRIHRLTVLPPFLELSIGEPTCVN